MLPKRRPPRRALGLVTAVLLTTGCGAASGGDADVAGEASGTPADIVATLSDRGLASASSAFENIDLDELLGGLLEGEEYTLLAPDDEAFLALTAEEAAEVMASDETLGSLMSNHLIEGRLELDDLQGLESITAMSGMELAVVTTSEGPTIGGATVSVTDVEPGGQMIYIVDKIFLP